ncbi:MAG: hypothetical protein ACK4ML_01020 [Alishewanella aestuarii]
MNEADFTSRIHSKIPADKVKAWKIKDDFQGGVPDAMYLSKHNPNGLVQPVVFIEYKYLKTLPKREKTNIIPALSELQKEWLRTALIGKSQAFVIVGYPDKSGSKGVVFYTPEEWENGITLAEFQSRALNYDGLVKLIVSQVIGV